jgi:hypothetical protein
MKLHMHTFVTKAKAIHPFAELSCHAMGVGENTLIEVRLPTYSSSIGELAAVVFLDVHGVIDEADAELALKKIAEIAQHPDVIQPFEPKTDAAA